MAPLRSQVSVSLVAAAVATSLVPLPAEGKVGGGVITAGSAYTTTNFDPSSTSSALACGTNWHVVEGLDGLDFHDYSVYNELAAGDPEQVDDTTYEIALRKDAKFSDGTPVTAADVAESFKRSTEEGNIYIPMLAPIASVEPKDDATVTVKTTVPNFSLLKERLAIVRVVPASSTKEDMTAKPVGSGPWMYEAISDSAVDMVPNPEYNGEHPAKDDKLHIDILVDPTARVTAQQEGSTLVMEMVTADAVEQLESAGCKIDVVDGFGTRFMLFNTQKAPWNDVKARQAVMYALDYEKMIENAFAASPPPPPATCPLPTPTIMRPPRSTSMMSRPRRSSSPRLASPAARSSSSPLTTSRSRACPSRSSRTSRSSASTPRS